MEPSFVLVYSAIALALLFNFSNGFHDAAGQVATVISARVLSPEAALVLASLGNLAGAFLMGTAVAKTIGTGIVDPQILKSSGIGLEVVASALLGGAAWNILTWLAGMPTSSSHALIGALGGAVLAALGGRPLQ